MVIPVEIDLLSNRVKKFYETTNSGQLKIDLDLLNEVREQAHIKMTIYKQRIAKYYNVYVKSKSFQKDDLVLRRAKVSKPTEQDKLAPNWERLYWITDVVLRDL